MTSSREIIEATSLSGRRVTLVDSGVKNTPANQVGNVRGAGSASDGGLVVVHVNGYASDSFLRVDTSTDTLSSSTPWTGFTPGEAQAVYESATRIFVGGSVGVRVLDPTTLTLYADEGFSLPTSTGDVVGMGNYGASGFWTAKGDGTVYLHDGPAFPEAAPPRFAYAWRDHNASGGLHETPVSPLSSASAPLRSRARIQVTIAPFTVGAGSDAISRARIYGGFGGTLYAQADAASQSTTLQGLADSGATPGSTPSFPPGTPAELRSQDGSSLVITADGAISGTSLELGGVDLSTIIADAMAPSVVGAKGRITSSHSLANNFTKVTGFTELWDTHDMMDGSAGNIVCPTGYAGIWVVSAALMFATNTSGRRFIQIEKGTAAAGNGANTVLIRQEISPAAGYAAPCVYAEVLLNEGDNIFLSAYQTSGGALDARGDFTPTVFSARFLAPAP